MKINLDRPLTERTKINNHHKFFKVAHLRDLEKLVQKGEITYSRMVELINELAYDFYVKNQKVFVVMEGENSEGGRVKGVFSDEDQANELSSELKIKSAICDWVDVEEMTINKHYEDEEDI